MNLLPEPCCLCGAQEVREFSNQGTSLAEPPRVCSPCRAERTGAIQMTVLADVDPRHVAERIRSHRPGSPATLEGAIHVGLRTWAEALRRSAESALLLLKGFEELPPEEAVAESVMGAPRAAALEAPPGRPGTVKLTGLAPELARRLAETVPLAEGPPLTTGELAALERELGWRAGDAP